MKIYHLKRLAFLAVLLGAANLASAAAKLSSSRTVEGVYTLEGMREMAATLILRQDNHFEYGAIYGGAEPRASGKWSVEDGIVHLVSDQRPPKYTRVEQDAGPLPDHLDEAGIRPAMAVLVTSPALGMTWSGVDVTFKFANGRSRNGRTGRSGVVYAGARTELEWRDVPIEEVGLALPEDSSKFFWIKVNDRRTTHITVEFDPGATTQAFKEGYLEIEEGNPRRLVAGRILGELRGTYVWQRHAKSGATP